MLRQGQVGRERGVRHSRFLSSCLKIRNSKHPGIESLKKELTHVSMGKKIKRLVVDPSWRFQRMDVESSEGTSINY